MPASRLTLSNFKAFGPVPQTVPLKPITLVFGPNSAGKSSLLHSLLWYRHGLNQGELDIQQPDCGPNVNLGGFDQMVFRHNPVNAPGFGWSIAGRRALAPGRDGWDTLERFDIELSFRRRFNDVLLSSCSIATPQGIMFRASRNAQCNWKVDLLDWSHPALSSLLATPGSSMSDQARLERLDLAVASGLYELKDRNFAPTQLSVNDNISKSIHRDDSWLLTEGLPGAFTRIFTAFREEIDARVQKMAFLPPLREVPHRNTDFRQQSSSDWQRIILHPNQKTIIKSINTKLAAMMIPYEVHLRTLVLEDTMIERVEAKLLDWMAETVAKSEYRIEFDKYRNTKHGSAGYLRGTLDGDLSDKLYQRWKALDNRLDWTKSRPDIYHAIHQRWMAILKKNLHDSSELDFYYEEHPEAKESVPPPDPWLHDYIDSLIERNNLGETDEDLILQALLADDPEVREVLSNGLDTKRLASSLRSDVATPGSRIEVCLRDLQHGVWVSLQDVGVGISQVLPVLFESLAGEGRLIAIEQPELHIHPRLQAELGDLFIEAALGESKNTFLIETHSEHLLLRIMRRMRNTFEGKLPDNMPAVRPDDVALLFVSPGPDGSIVQEIGLSECGELIKGWPGGFFEEGFNEMFD